MPSFWYLKTITQTRTASGEQFVLVTDVPCHLWLRYSFIEPKKHTIPVERRGLPLREDLYFCFDSYLDVEQVEPGDTLIHTIIVEPWPYCQERWYYFHGEIAGVPSPSTTPVFYKHPIAPPGPVATNDCQPLFSHNYGYCQFWNAAGQTFTPDHDYTAQSLSLRLNQYTESPLYQDRKGYYRVKITLVSGSCWSEPVLFQYNGYSLDLPVAGSTDWTSFPIPDLFLGAGILYRIVVHTIATPTDWLVYYSGRWWPGPTYAAIRWWDKAATNPYTRGRMCWGCNFKTSSGAWAYSANDDHSFCIYARP